MVSNALVASFSFLIVSGWVLARHLEKPLPFGRGACMIFLLCLIAALGDISVTERGGWKDEDEGRIYILKSLPVALFTCCMLFVFFAR